MGSDYKRWIIRLILLFSVFIFFLSFVVIIVDLARLKSISEIVSWLSSDYLVYRKGVVTNGMMILIVIGGQLLLIIQLIKISRSSKPNSTKDESYGNSPGDKP